MKLYEIPTAKGYFIDLKGNAYSTYLPTYAGTKRIPPKKLKLRVSHKGYLMIQIGTPRKMMLYHRVVASIFIPNPKNKECVNHKNGIKLDNRIKNLEWVTEAENKIHAGKMGLMARGEQHFNSKLTDKKVLKIRKLLREGLFQKDIALIMKVDASTISYVKSKRIWGHVK